MQTKLKTILFEQGISQKNLAKEIGIGEHSMCDKIHGRIDFTYTEVFDICRVLGIKNPLEVLEPKAKGGRTDDSTRESRSKRNAP